jgi:hypothetical protein
MSAADRGLDTSVNAGSFPGVASDAPSASGVQLHQYSPIHIGQLSSSCNLTSTHPQYKLRQPTSKLVALFVPIQPPDSDDSLFCDYCSGSQVAGIPIRMSDDRSAYETKPAGLLPSNFDSGALTHKNTACSNNLFLRRARKRGLQPEGSWFATITQLDKAPGPMLTVED